MKILQYLLLLLAANIFCSDKRVVDQIHQASELYRKSEYELASQIYTNIIKNYPKSPWADSARQYLNTCQIALYEISNAFTKSNELLANGEYEKADSVLLELSKTGVVGTIKTKIAQKRAEIKQAKNSDIEYLMKIITERIRKGIPYEFALYDLVGTQIKWKAVIESDLDWADLHAFIFKKDKRKFIGFAADFMTYILLFHHFIENEIIKLKAEVDGKVFPEPETLIVNGTLYGVSRYPYARLIVRIDAADSSGTH